MEIHPRLINLRPHPTDPYTRWLCYGSARLLLVLCDDWGDRALVDRAMQSRDAIVQSLVDQMSGHQNIEFLAAAEGRTLD